MVARLGRRDFVGGAALSAALWVSRPSRAASAMGFDDARHLLSRTAFGLSLLTGSLMFITQATEYFANTTFRIKLVLLLLAGVNMLIFELGAARSAASWKDGRAAPCRQDCGCALIGIVDRHRIFRQAHRFHRESGMRRPSPCAPGTERPYGRAAYRPEQFCNLPGV